MPLKSRDVVPASIGITTTAMSELLTTEATEETDRHLRRQLRFSIAISASRCLLTYVVLPLLSPIIQPALGSEPTLGIPLSVTALFFDARAIRSIRRSDHRWRLELIVGYLLLMGGIAALLAHNLWSIAR